MISSTVPSRFTSHATIGTPLAAAINIPIGSSTVLIRTICSLIVGSVLIAISSMTVGFLPRMAGGR